jgi:hypothetical protein
MNKFKQLQLIGTLTVLSPVLLLVGALIAYNFPESELVEEVKVKKVEIPKVDTVVVIKEVEKIIPPTLIVNKPVPPTQTPTPPPIVVKDTVKVVVKSLDTIK